jgi:hypothetical protein
MKTAPIIVPALRAGPMFLMSAMSDLIPLLYSLPTRQLPEIFADILAALDNFIDQFLIVTHNRRVDIAKRDNDRARQRRHIDDFRRALFFGISDGIRQNQAAFGIGVENFDRLTVHRRDDIARREALPSGIFSTAAMIPRTGTEGFSKVRSRALLQKRSRRPTYRISSRPFLRRA